MTKNAIIFSRNEKISRLVSNELLLASISVKTVSSPSGEAEISGAYDFVVVDLTSLEPSSLASVRTFLTRNVSAFKICISSTEESQHTLWSFNKYLSSPFRLEELRSVLANRGQNELRDSDEKNVDTAKSFFVDKEHRGVTLEGTYVPLSRYEFDTLRLLCQNRGKCVERAQILKMLNSSDGNISDVYISHLRNKLELPFGLKIIYTVRSKGYMTDYAMSEYLP